MIQLKLKFNGMSIKKNLQNEFKYENGMRIGWFGFGVARLYYTKVQFYAGVNLSKNPTNVGDCIPVAKGITLAYLFSATCCSTGASLTGNGENSH